MYARSPVDVVDNDPGKDWLSSSGFVVGVAESLPIVPSSEGILALPIPKHSGSSHHTPPYSPPEHLHRV